MSRLLFLVACNVMLLLVVGAQKQESFLDSAGNFHISWELDPQKLENITFEVTVKTQGWVGFGIAPKASMIGADLIIGGVKDGVPYFSDRHSDETVEPVVDTVQNWKLIDAKENGSYTYLKFWRALDTCDEQDLVISSDTLNIIWSYGQTDDISYHGDTSRGGRQFNLLDPPEPEFDTSLYTSYKLRVTDPIPATETTYLCTIHKLQKFETKHHMIAVDPHLPDENAVRHTHHFTATSCKLDDDELNAELEQLLDKPGQACYEGIYGRLKPKCNTILFGWAVGGKRIVMPEHVGIPIGGEESKSDQFIMFEVHYDNPKSLAGVEYTTGFDLYFTNKTRKEEGSVIVIGIEFLPSLFIPPQQKEFTVTGHCSSEYTRAFLPPGGVKVVDVTMHSHLSGRRLRMRHFRDGVELPWILSDDHYDFDYQQTRALEKEITILPGDHLTMECVMNTEGRTNITIAGESTKEEMCHTYLVYYPKMDLTACRSFYPLDSFFSKFGIYDWDRSIEALQHLNPHIILPKEYANKTFFEIANAMEYTPQFVEELQHDIRWGNHVSTFALDPKNQNHVKADFTYNSTSYPKYEEDYVLPLSPCVQEGTEVPTTGASTTEASGSGSSLFASCLTLFVALLSLSGVYKRL